MKPDELARTCEAVATLNAKYRHTSSTKSLIDATSIVSALHQFMECVRYLNTRRSSSAVLTLDSEAAVQDALFLMLKPWIPDLTWESPTEKVASRFVIKDFISRSARTIVEAKFIRDDAHGKSISKELNDDIEMYRSHPVCRDVIFFVYDRDVLIPDRTSLEQHVVVKREYDGVPLTCHLLVKP